ncbi:MAG: hypothetical protein O3C02_03400, partial [Cyanobacteria bacterium]|nr:hypothetical protein [Cyanobacteriota bacterium]
ISPALSNTLDNAQEVSSGLLSQTRVPAVDTGTRLIPSGYRLISGVFRQNQLIGLLLVLVGVYDWEATATYAKHFGNSLRKSSQRHSKTVAVGTAETQFRSCNEEMMGLTMSRYFSPFRS